MKYSKIILVVIALSMISCVASGGHRHISPFVDENEIRNNSDRRMSLDAMFDEARKEMDREGGFFNSFKRWMQSSGSSERSDYDVSDYRRTSRRTARGR